MAADDGLTRTAATRPLLCRLGFHKVRPVGRETHWFEECACVRCFKRGWRVIRL